MTIRAGCLECGQTYSVGEDKAGRRFRCKKCDGMVDVPMIEDDLEDIYAPPALPKRGSQSGKGKSRSSSPPVQFGIRGFLQTWNDFGKSEGRATRTEYWNFTIIQSIIGVVTVFVAFLVMGDPDHPNMLGAIIMIAAGLYLLASILPGINVSIRRMHDTDRSGWWWLVNFIPYLGGFIFLVLCLLPGTDGTNSYGPSPR